MPLRRRSIRRRRRPVAVAVDERLGKEQASVGFSYAFDAEPGDEAALLVAGAMLSDRLSFRLREELGLAYSMSASCAPWGGRMRFDADRLEML